MFAGDDFALNIALGLFRCRPPGDCCSSTCAPVSLAELASLRATTADCTSEEVGDGFCDFELNNEVRLRCTPTPTRGIERLGKVFIVPRLHLAKRGGTFCEIPLGRCGLKPRRIQLYVAHGTVR